jgi:DNA-binding IclR family transcriptional regulator
MDRTAVKAFRLLERLAESERPRGVSDLARASGLGKSNVHRTLATLQALGYARRTEDGAYEATLRVWEVGVQVLNRVSVQRIAAPHLEELAAASGETAHLAIPEAEAAVYLAIIESTRAVRTFTRVGQRVPLHATAVGKVFIAYGAASAAPKLARFTEATIVQPGALDQETERIRKQGYAFNLGEWGEGVHGIAAPVFDHRGGVIAALALSGPAARLNATMLRRVAPRVVETARRVSRELGWSPLQF